MGEIKTQYIESAYNEAVSYARSICNECEDSKESYINNDAFYKKTDTKDWVAFVLLTVIAGLLFFFKNIVVEKIMLFFSLGWSAGRLATAEPYLQVFVTYLAVVFAVFGVWSLIKILYSSKRNAEIKEVSNVASRIETEIEGIKDLGGRIVSSIQTGEAFVVEAGNSWEDRISAFNNKANETGKNTRLAAKVLGLLIGAVACLFTYFVFEEHIMAGLIGEFNYVNVFATSVFYLLLMLYIYKMDIWLSGFIGNKAKFFGLGMFMLIQIILVLRTAQTGAFDQIKLLINAFQTGDAGSLDEQFLINSIRALFELVITTIIGLMYTIRLDADRQSIAEKEGTIMVPMTDGSQQERTVNIMERWKGIVALTAFSIIAPWFMSWILSDDISFGRVVLYVVLGLVWFGGGTFFTGDDVKAIYGKRLAWVRTAMFWVYFFLTLSLVPGFGIGSILLILLQTLLSLIVVGIIMMVI